MQKQFVGQRSQFGPLCQGPGQVLVGEGETFNGNEVQRRRMGRSVSLPGLPALPSFWLAQGGRAEL